MSLHAPGSSRWLFITALVAVAISVPALAAAERSSSGTPTAKAKKKKKATSNRGPRGKQGPRGIQGPSGRAGINGVGVTGPAGPKGDRGETGDQKTKVLNLTMSAGDPDALVLNYPPFTITASCQSVAGTITAKLSATTTTNDSYLDSENGEQLADFDVVSGAHSIATLTEAAPGPRAHRRGDFFLAGIGGGAVSGFTSIGTNVYATVPEVARACLFTGAISTT